MSKIKVAIAFSAILACVLTLGVAQLAAPPAQAVTCEEVCYQDYLECLQLITRPGTCQILYQNCLNDCP